jgi:hypothetical protein
MDTKSSLRGIILSQLKKSKSLSFRDRAESVSFSYCSQKEKRELVAMEIQGPDGWDMLYNTDGPDLLQIIYSVYVKKNLSAEQGFNLILDGLARRYNANLDEKLEAEFMEYLDEVDFTPDNHEYLLDRANRARDAQQSQQAGW